MQEKDKIRKVEAKVKIKYQIVLLNKEINNKFVIILKFIEILLFYFYFK